MQINMNKKWSDLLINKKTLVAPVLGQREIQTLDFFWQSQQKQLSALDVKKLVEIQTCQLGESISINTIQSTMERLWRKGLLARTKVGKAYMYTTLFSKQQVISSLLSEIKNEMGQGDDLVMLSGIVEYLQTWDCELTDKLISVFKEHTAASGTK
jgi:predicted transcriptional regulator